MKKYGKYLIAAVAGLVFFAACDNYEADDHKFGNAVYLDVAETNEVQLTTFGNNKPTYDCALQAELTYPAGQDVAVTLTVDPSLVGTYNARYGTEWTMLDAKYYELSAESVTIAAGKTTSDVVTLQFKELMGQGEEQTGALPIDETYLVPVRIGHASMDVLHGSDVAYYVVKRSSAITVAAQLTDNWIEFPTLDKYSESSKAWNGLTAVTYEALIYLDDFATSNATGSPVNISSIMGVEQYLLLRIGDTNFERQQLQFDGSGAGSSFGKIPGRDATKNLEKGRWYHVACTYDQAARTARIYVDGQIQSEATDVGISAQSKKNQINLAMRALRPVEYGSRQRKTAVRERRHGLQQAGRGLPVLPRPLLRRLPSSERQDRRSTCLVGGPYARTDLGQYVRHSKPAGRSDASWLLEVQRCLGQYGQGLFDVPQ